jgi:hypothetical protein
MADPGLNMSRRRGCEKRMVQPRSAPRMAVTAGEMGFANFVRFKERNMGSLEELNRGNRSSSLISTLWSHSGTANTT